MPHVDGPGRIHIPRWMYLNYYDAYSCVPAYMTKTNILRSKIKDLSRTGKLFYLTAVLQEYSPPNSEYYWITTNTTLSAAKDLIKELTDGPVQTSNTYRPLTGRSFPVPTFRFSRQFSKYKKGWNSNIRATNSIKQDNTSDFFKELNARSFGKGQAPTRGRPTPALV